MTPRTIVWFRGEDLRISDHAPLRAALAAGEVIPLFVLDPDFFAPARARELPNRMQFLLDALCALEAALADRGSRLLVVAGKSVEVVPRLAREWEADRVVAQRRVEPFARERDRRIREALGAKFELSEGETLMPPGTLRTGAGRPYSVFSQFARVFRWRATIGKPLPPPRSLPPVPSDIRARVTAIPTCEQLGIDRNPALLHGGEQAAKARLRRFLRDAAAAYPERRDRMDLPGTSRLSADLKFGTISARQVWTAVEDALGGTPAARSFLNELVWREFTHSTLWDRPALLETPFRPAFEGFPWHDDEELWQAWVNGKTGYPVVDAASRQLLGEGFVHNRARMISASFLCKHLLIDYRRGEAHYMKYLTDGDRAQNNAGWQWSAGCGCDAQPYFRIFNPVTQGERFDPEGNYVRRWVPELEKMPARYIHDPSEAPDAVLRAAGVRLDESYPRPVVDHRFARERFLAVAAQHLTRGVRRRASDGSPCVITPSRVPRRRRSGQRTRMRPLHRAAGALALALLLALPSAPLADVRPFADFEVGWAIPGYNDVRIPGNSGTLFSLNEDGVAISPAPYARLKLGATFASRHTVFVTGAPLRLQARGTLPSDVSFDGGAYPAGTFVTGQYRFDTWRLTYRYTFWSSPRLEATVGLTGLVRDAGISLHGGDVFQEKLNTGLVPLLSFSVLWRFAGPWSLLLDGDALAGGPGRAEDVTIALRRQLGHDLAVRVGYRVVEGGADVDEVYNFALVSYVGAALEVGF